MEKHPSTNTWIPPLTLVIRNGDVQSMRRLNKASANRRDLISSLRSDATTPDPSSFPSPSPVIVNSRVGDWTERRPKLEPSRVTHLVSLRRLSCNGIAVATEVGTAI